jgi:hypothetical protein
MIAIIHKLFIMKNFRTIIALCAIALIIFALTQIDYNDLSWHTNKSNYLGIISMIFTLTAMILTNISESKHKKSVVKH